MTRPHGDAIAQSHLFQGSPSGILIESHPREMLTGSDLAALTTQVMTTVAIPLQAGDKVTSITFLSGGTAAGTPTNWWFALYSPAGALLSQSADQTTAAWAADTAKTLALATAQVASAAGIYYVGIMVKATTVPTLMGRTVGRAALAGNVGSLGFKVLAQTSGSALTDTAPETIATPTTIATVPWCAVS